MKGSNRTSCPTLKGIIQTIFGSTTPPIALFWCVMLGVSLHGQSLDQGLQQLTTDQQAFEAAADKYVAEHLNEVKAALQNSLDHSHDHDHHGHQHEEVTPDQLDAMAREQARHVYIRQHMAEYLETYFGPEALMPTEVTNTVCDNGGFEEDFLYYEGFTSTFRTGSNMCQPFDGGFVPSVFVQSSMPLVNRFRIIDTILDGNTDPLIGIDMVKFGRKSLKLNSQEGHLNKCAGDFGIDKITKTFVVTPETRSFTVWYALALENPSSHINRQPYLSIECDRAPDDNLCFDADFLKCMDVYEDPCRYDSIDVLNWTCHRFNIPASFVDSIATIEISVADCGRGGHFGYAYIDGFCESCAGSALGSISLPGSDNLGITKSCDGNTLTVCGNYTTPQICDTVTLDSIVLSSNYTIPFMVDTVNETFCFDLDLSDIKEFGCIDLFAEIYFSTPTGTEFYEFSNIKTICESDFGAAQAAAVVGACNSIDDNSLSDDYYFVELNISEITPSMQWSIDRFLTNTPYPNESGEHTLQTGTGNTTVILGPFYIQGGSWTLYVDVDNCPSIAIPITPPDYCSGCDVFNGFEVRDIKCDDLDSGQSNDDEWSVELFIPGPAGQGFVLDGPRSFNSSFVLNGYDISEGCQDFTLEYEHLVTKEVCIQDITICPPKPCSDDTDCGDLEVYINEINCVDEDPNVYTVDLSVNYTGSNQLCYEPALPASSPTTSTGTGITTGPLTGPQQITVKVCPPMVSCEECKEDYLCIKTIFVTPPEDCDRDLEGSDPRGGDTRGRAIADEMAEPRVFPNPTTGVFTIEHAGEYRSYRVLDLTGRVVTEGKLNSTVDQITIDDREGLYFVHLSTLDGEYIVRRVVKLN